MKHKNIKISQDELKKFLSYDEFTGEFTWISGEKYLIGKVAGWIENNGYRRIKVNREIYLAHRLAFLYMTGKEPLDMVDHIDNNKSNNIWINLRECNNEQNQQNHVKARVNSKTGVLGVYLRYGKYRACIRVNGKGENIGAFETLEEAKNAYIQRKRQLHEYTTL